LVLRGAEGQVFCKLAFLQRRDRDRPESAPQTPNSVQNAFRGVCTMSPRGNYIEKIEISQFPNSPTIQWPVQARAMAPARPAWLAESYYCQPNRAERRAYRSVAADLGQIRCRCRTKRA